MYFQYINMQKKERMNVSELCDILKLCFQMHLSEFKL